MNGILIFLFIVWGGASILGKGFSAVGRFFRPTTEYIGDCIIDVLMSMGVSRRLAIALLPFIKILLVVFGFAMFVWFR